MLVFAFVSLVFFMTGAVFGIFIVPGGVSFCVIVVHVHFVLLILCLVVIDIAVVSVARALRFGGKMVVARNFAF